MVVVRRGYAVTNEKVDGPWRGKCSVIFARFSEFTLLWFSLSTSLSPYSGHFFRRLSFRDALQGLVSVYSSLWFLRSARVVIVFLFVMQRIIAV